MQVSIPIFSLAWNRFEDENKQKKFHAIFPWLHVIILKWREIKIDVLVYTMQGKKNKSCETSFAYFYLQMFIQIFSYIGTESYEKSRSKGYILFEWKIRKTYEIGKKVHPDKMKVSKIKNSY